MENPVVIGLTILGVVIGLGFGYLLARLAIARRAERDTASAGDVVTTARLDAQRILSKAEEEGRAKAEAYREREEANLEHRRLEVSNLESRMSQREETLDQRASNLAQREKMLIDREEELNTSRGDLELLKEQARFRLEQIAGIDINAAKTELLAQVEDEARREAMIVVRDLEIKAREEADRRARRILATAIQRLSSEVVTETTVSVIQLPSDDMKGRIIGREGRNIRHLESVTGTNLIVDDTPEAVSVSSFDPVRREVARITLEKLVADGRIHPASIEEAYEKARAEVEQSIRDAGEWALVEAGVSRMHSEIITLMGRLKYRTSYGQNVLNHLVETAHIASMLASELGIDPAPVKRAALLHDLGKAVTHEVEPRTILAVIVQAADAVSAARPGARRETLEGYVKRLERLETLAMEFPGVDHVFALQAGREVRVVVDPGNVSDLDARDLSRKIARKLEEDLQYPGQIQVTVIREYRATDFAR